MPTEVQAHTATPRGILTDILHHPRRLWLRKAIFQIHLWAGILLSLYLILIALSGSILVYKAQLTRWSLPVTLHPFEPATTAPLQTVVAHFTQANPQSQLTVLQTPSSQLPAFLLTGKDALGHPARWFADPVTAAIYPAPHTWLDTVHDFHYYLLLPPTPGLQLNALGAAVLLLLALTGLILWWPGLRLWTRGLRVNLHANWRRINYDTHNALGFWTLAIVLWWAFSGVYFGFYRQVSAAVNAVSTLRGMAQPATATLPPVTPGVHASLADILQSAQAASPHGRLFSLSNPSLQTPEVYALMDLRAPGDFSHRDIVRLRTADARVLSTWHYGVRHSLGDWVLWSMHPLHFGTLWGPWIQALYALLGLILALLTATGLLMYWNRFLRHKLPH